MMIFENAHESGRQREDAHESGRQREDEHGRDHGEEPLAHYVELMGMYLALSTGALFWLKRTGRPLPRRVPVRDVVLLGLAANRLSRLVTRDKVTRPVRAPFTEVDPEAPKGEQEKPRGDGWQRAVGELLTCPRCAAMWASLALTIGYLAAPRATRGLSTLLGAAAISDYLNTRFASARASAT